MNKIFLSEDHKNELLRILREHVSDASVLAFGSRIYSEGSAARCHEGSDLDLVVKYPEGYDGAQGSINKLILALQESTLPFLIDVHNWSTIPSDFHRNILANHLVIQAADMNL